jgi:DNA-binding transcriptional LysR family regulator
LLVAKIADWEDHIGRRLRLRDLRVFFAVMQSGSLSKAARHLHVSHPAVSQVIADLEDALGVQLFDRNTRGVEPTRYARILLARGRAAFDELRQGIRDIEFLTDLTAHELTIGYTLSIADTVLPQVVERFSSKFPRVVMQVNIVPTPSYKFPGLRDRSYDLIVTRIPMPIPDDDALTHLIVEPLFDDPWVLAAGMSSRWSRRRKVDVAELLQEPWVMPPPGTSGFKVLGEVFKDRDVGMPPPTLTTYSMALRAKLSAKGRFITFLPKSFLRYGEQRDTLKELAVVIPSRPWSIAILTLKNRTLSPVVQCFMECAREVTKVLRKPTP